MALVLGGAPELLLRPSFTSGQVGLHPRVRGTPKYSQLKARAPTLRGSEIRNPRRDPKRSVLRGEWGEENGGVVEEREENKVGTQALKEGGLGCGKRPAPAASRDWAGGKKFLQPFWLKVALPLP